MTATRLSILSLGMALMLIGTSSPIGYSQGTDPSTKNAKAQLIVTVTDKRGRYVTPIGKDQITVLEENVPLELSSVEQLDQPMSIGLVFDMSRDDRSGWLASAKSALSDFVRASGKEHRYFIIGFDSAPYLAADWVRSPAEIAAGFDRLTGVNPPRKAALYDALDAALVKTSEAPLPKRAIILISDGRNNGSKLKREELFESVRRSDALVYAVSAKAHGGSTIDPSDYGTLEKLCSISGGFVSSAGTESDLNAFFEHLSAELKNQYSVSYIPTSRSANGGWRRLSYKAQDLELKRAPASKDVERVQLYVRGREGYYSR